MNNKNNHSTNMITTLAHINSIKDMQVNIINQTFDLFLKANQPLLQYKVSEILNDQVKKQKFIHACD